MYDAIKQELSGLNKDDINKIVLSKSKSEVKKATIRPILLKTAESGRLKE